MNINDANSEAIAMDLQRVIEDKLDRLKRTCLNCSHFDEPSEACRKYDNQRPPARIIALGCDGHEDEIPF